MEFLLFKDGVFHTIRTEINPLGQGGEGAIYRIIYPEKLNTHCVKIYYPNKITAEKQNKLTYLSEHTPITDSKGHKSVIWVEGIVYDTKQNFSGICMPIAKGYSLEYLSVSKFPQKRIKPEELKNYKKFDREHKNNITARIAVCHNIAIAVGQLHHSQQYVHGDIKPENIIFDANSRVSIIDFDTVQVSEQNTLSYPMLAQTPEYIPPIYQNANLKNTIAAPFMDIFSMTVIFYRILLGIHPFASTNFKVPYQNITTIPEAIQAKLLHFGKNSSYFTQINAMHKKFSEFPKSLRELFTEVLENENTAIRAADWIDVIKNPEVLQTLKEILNPQKTSAKIQGITLNNDNTLLIPLYSASNKTWGYCTIDKKTVIPCEYDYVTAFSQNNLASVQKGQYSGVIDKTGKTIIPFVYKNTWIVKDVLLFLLKMELKAMYMLKLQHRFLHGTNTYTRMRKTIYYT